MGHKRAWGEELEATADVQLGMMGLGLRAQGKQRRVQGFGDVQETKNETELGGALNEPSGSLLSRFGSVNQTEPKSLR